MILIILLAVVLVLMLAGFAVVYHLVSQISLRPRAN